MSKAGEVVDLAAIVVAKLQDVRDALSDTEMDQLCDNAAIDELISSVIELEASIEEVSTS